jgi:hypothetical protein
MSSPDDALSRGQPLNWVPSRQFLRYQNGMQRNYQRGRKESRTRKYMSLLDSSVGVELPAGIFNAGLNGLRSTNWQLNPLPNWKRMSIKRCVW